MNLPNNPSESLRRLNPHLFGVTTAPLPAPATRIRQASKPRMNKLEQEWFNILNVQYPAYPRPRPQAVRFEIASGCHYTPDVFAISWPNEFGPVSPAMPTAWEVKGKKMWDDAVVKIKVAARVWPDITWIMCWKEPNGQWQTQRIMP